MQIVRIGSIADEDTWLIKRKIAELCDTTQKNISQHIECIYKGGEWERNLTNKKLKCLMKMAVNEFRRLL